MATSPKPKGGGARTRTCNTRRRRGHHHVRRREAAKPIASATHVGKGRAEKRHADAAQSPALEADGHAVIDVAIEQWLRHQHSAWGPLCCSW